VRDLGPTRIIVRDLPWVKTEDTQEPVWETKTENIIDRRTGAAKDPRTCERVPSGTKFHFQVTVQFYDEDKNFEFRGKKGSAAFIRAICLAIKCVESTGLGSGVSRGSGQIKFGKVEVKVNGEPVPCD
jgi:CRISPR-associated protein Csm3